jgi:hypothetical protein
MWPKVALAIDHFCSMILFISCSCRLAVRLRQQGTFYLYVAQFPRKARKLSHHQK